MITIIKQFVKRELASTVPKSFKIFVDTGSELLLADDTTTGFTKYIHYKFVRGRNYIIPSVAWSKTGQFPNSKFRRKHGESIPKDESVFDEHESLWVDPTDFGNYPSTIALENDTASRNRLVDLYDSEYGKSVLKQLEVDDWKTPENNWLCDWESVELNFKSEITQQDCSYAIGNLTDQNRKLVDELFLPYLKGVSDRIK